MKKKAVALLLCVSMMMTLNACGKTNKDNTQGTETVAETETEVIPSSADITYDAGDYVSLGDYMNMEVTLDKDYQVTDEMVKNYVNNNVIANYPYYVESDKTVVENGDVANIDYEGLLDGEAFDGGTAQDYDLEIGSGSFIDGFEDGLIGAEVGKEVVFKVTVNAIKVKQDITYDTLTDEYVTYLSDKLGASYETVSDLTSDIRTYLEEQANSSRTQAIRSAVIAKLPEVCTVNALPDGLLDARMQEYLKKFEDTYCKDTTLEDYLSSTYNTTVDDFKTQVQSEIETELDTQLILEAIAAVENIEFDEDGFNSYVSSLLSNYGYDSEDALYENYAQTAEDGKDYLQTIYLCNKALDRVIENTNVTYNAAEESTEEAAAAENITETEAATEE